MDITLKLAIVFAIGVGCLSAPAITLAQTTNSPQSISSLELNDVDVRDAIAALCKQAGVSYSLDPKVQGRVTVSFKNVSLEAALENIVRQVDAEYTIVSGIYQIRRRDDPSLPPTTGPNSQQPAPSKTVRRRVKVNHADPEMIIASMSGGNGSYGYGFPERSTVNALDKFERDQRAGFSRLRGGGPWGGG